MTKQFYFAHPVNIYGEPLEAAFEELIAQALTGGRHDVIENPNQPCHQIGYDRYARRKKESGLNHKGMNYFYDEVLPNCLGCVAVPFLDFRIGRGVAGEMQWFIEKNKPVWIVFPVCGISNNLSDFVRNPLSGCFDVRPLAPEEKQRIILSDPKFVVPHEETRLRTWRIYNKDRRPYEEAHLVSMPVPEGFYPQG